MAIENGWIKLDYPVPAEVAERQAEITRLQRIREQRRRKEARRKMIVERALIIVAAAAVIAIFGFAIAKSSAPAEEDISSAEPGAMIGAKAESAQNYIKANHIDQKDAGIVIFDNTDPKFTAPIDAAYPISAEDRDLIERVVSAECRGEEYRGILAVAQTIRDRAEGWGVTPKEVVTAEGQYAAPYDGEAPEIVKLAVSDVFDYGVRATKANITHFYAQAKCCPYWADTFATVEVIGGHTFTE